MSGASITVADTAAALAAGEIPGAFAADRESFAFPVVESRSTRGKLLTWRQEVSLVKDMGTGIGYLPVAVTDTMLQRGAAQLGRAYKGRITAYAKQEGGEERVSGVVFVTAGKNIGKANATNVITQAFRDALGQYNKHRKVITPSAATATVAAAATATAKTDTKTGREAGSKTDREAGSKATGETDDSGDADKKMAVVDKQPPPMLAKKNGATRKATIDAAMVKKGVIVQRKYNGVRLICYRDGDAVKIYSRTSGAYAGLDHIRAALLPLLGEGVYVDGEAYSHGRSLQWISGQTRGSADEGTLDLMIYDCFFPAEIARGVCRTGTARQAYLDTLLDAAAAESASSAAAKPASAAAKPAASGEEVKSKKPASAAAKPASAAPKPTSGGEEAKSKKQAGILRRAENFYPKTLVELHELCRGFVRDGYEGGMVRVAAAGYEYSYNKHKSDCLIKVKPVQDSEFKVVDFTHGKKGKDEKAIIWICEVDPAHVKDPKNKRFRVTPNLPLDARNKLYAALSAVDAASGTTRFAREIRGLALTVTYPERTELGKPAQAKALAFRTYEAGPQKDVIAKLYKECGIAVA